MKINKKKLLAISAKVSNDQRLTPGEIDLLYNFKLEDKSTKLNSAIKKAAFPLAVSLGFIITVFASFFEQLSGNFPSWTNLSPSLLAGVNYLWNFFGEPIDQANIIYHLPNIVMYAFGFFGIKKLVESVERRSWLDTVLKSQATLKERVESGRQGLALNANHSILFVGKGDFVADQFVKNHSKEETIALSSNKPVNSLLWIKFDFDSQFNNLATALDLADAQGSGEYLFFPVKDDQLFLPGQTAFDLSPQKLDLIIQNIRTIEKEKKWKNKKIIIIGDCNHKSIVQSEDKQKIIKNSKEIISLQTISDSQVKTFLIDPSHVVIKEILNIAKGRKVIFRATKEGIKEYKDRFYDCLTKHGYQDKNSKDQITILYDIYDDLTEQQALKKSKAFLPVILSSQVRETIIRHGYQKHEFLYVPELVLAAMKRLTK